MSRDRGPRRKDRDRRPLAAAGRGSGVPLWPSQVTFGGVLLRAGYQPGGHRGGMAPPSSQASVMQRNVLVEPKCRGPAPYLVFGPPIAPVGAPNRGWTTAVSRGQRFSYDGASLESPPQCGRYLADHIPGARYLEVDGADHAPWFTEPDRILTGIEEF